MTNLPSPAIRFQNLSVSFDGIKVLDNITAEIPAGSVTALIGPNGAGKTTALKVILNKVPYSGKVQFLTAEGQSVTPRFGYVPQVLDFDRGIPMTVIDFLVMPHQKKPLWLGRRRALVEKAEENLSLVEAAHLAPRPLGKLSGGELQRVLLASALSGNPNLLLLDEPVSGIDIAGERLFCDLLESIHHRRHFTMVIVSHDLSVVTNHADHVICLNKSVICHGETARILTPENLQAVFGHHIEVVRYPHPEKHKHD